MAKYAFPDVLVTTEWVAEHQQDPNVRIVESDEDLLVYQQGHIPGAVRLDWHTDLENPVIRDFIDKERFEQLCARRASRTTRPSCSTAIRTTGGPAMPSGSSSSMATKSASSWTAAASAGNSTASRWCAIRSRPIRRPRYHAKEPDLSIRAFRDEVLKHARARQAAGRRPLAGRIQRRDACTCPTIRRKGRCAAAIFPERSASPGRKAVNDDGTFKSAKELEQLYLQGEGSDAPRPVDRLLPHRRALEPHLVRAQVPARRSAT